MAWLQKNYLLKRRGCLLADDMGLGKTLQILSFLAWLIEKGEIGTEESPWYPILIVAPLMLIENEIWINDMRRFFRGNGSVFEPLISLYGKELKKHRVADGSETVVGGSVLDLEKLKSYRVILTNYDTVTTYQHSFAKMKGDLSVVVTDEAQEYKDQNTKISHALKSLSPGFRIAATGTPVETRLLNVWNIFDFLQPGYLLGSASAFSNEYEKNNDTIESRGLENLKRKLRYGCSDAFVLRRDKGSVNLGLPPKTVKKIFCDLSDMQRSWHSDWVAGVRSGQEGLHPLSVLQNIIKLYQHPQLIDTNLPDSAEVCPKLGAMMQELEDIRRKNEKVLIFTRSLQMQQILKNNIDRKFGLKVGIVNGSTPRAGATQSANLTRKGIIEAFRLREGFDAIILSPDVVSTGLTLVEANHVFHYGRWWNPAKEMQATDRAYRIGQEREVCVYYFIAKDPAGQFKSFDERLDELIDRRLKLAHDFLSPLPNEDDLTKELYKSVFEGQAFEPKVPPQPISPRDVYKLSWDRFETLIAVLEEKSGAKVILTPKSGDGGIDVISVFTNEIFLIQCKHSQWDSDNFKLDVDVINEIVCAVDGYRANHLNDFLDRYRIIPVIVSNKNFTRQARREARNKDMYLRSYDDISQAVKLYSPSMIDLEVMEQQRVKSMVDMKKMLNLLIK